ncbi:BrxA/BrxB family bacilliredoxin [Kroppenstedtia eburnea]|uniref:Putative bacilliredoxin, YphP/YqiW family n=1 Tax=Kroppenstedtia eburnea TaxID=714067 RepID=A0A1N7Q763_9BACL|nr:BrxA/BrxB family bacilliredoxin [Kroppenstedtia eburnea]EGK08703.1 YqiW like protein [Desmospora sp. 8437]QKI81100.1 BrxA/BrxB family bacilliredoxin [Kroppenstedtia eburnea]SIT18693.1 putative bacilliredoxin, YphP/YqiW family [Kroppenstedtia eburnea]
MAQDFYIQQMQSMVQPMRDELTRIGFEELRTPEEVVEALEEKGAKGTALVVVNSVCGCAAGLARPAVAHSLNNERKPDHLFTVFAGQDREATAKAREYFEGYPPSSPSFALMKDGKIVHMVQRHEIEDRSLEEISANLTSAYDKYC